MRALFTIHTDWSIVTSLAGISNVACHSSSTIGTHFANRTLFAWLSWGARGSGWTLRTGRSIGSSRSYLAVGTWCSRRTDITSKPLTALRSRRADFTSSALSTISTL